MNQQDYLIAWGVYTIAGVSLMLVLWLMTGWMWRWLREPLRLITFILLFTPTPVNPQNDLYAPAIAITALDVLFKVGNNAWRAVSDLALVALVGFGLYLLFAVIRWPLKRVKENHRRLVYDSGDEPTLRRLMRPALMPDIDSRTDERGKQRVRIEPHL